MLLSKNRNSVEHKKKCMELYSKENSFVDWVINFFLISNYIN